MNRYPLSREELNLLDTCEEAIGQGLAHFIEVGRALSRVKDGRLYRETHKSFQSYLKDRFRLSKPYAYQLINAAGVAENVPVENEAQARVLSSMTESQQVEIWRLAKENKGDSPVTAQDLQETARAIADEDELPDVVDEEPDFKAIALVDALSLFAFASSSISYAIGNLEKILSDESGMDPGRLIRRTTMISDLKAILRTTRLAVPYSTCVSCLGYGTGEEPCFPSPVP